MLLTMEDMKGLVPTGDGFRHKAILDEVKTLEDIDRIDLINEQFTAVYGYTVIINISDVLKLKNTLHQV